VVLMNVGTANANVGRAAKPAKGRLYVLLAGADDEQLTALDEHVHAALARLSCQVLGLN
jgi:hypothetical protein